MSRRMCVCAKFLKQINCQKHTLTCSKPYIYHFHTYLCPGLLGEHPEPVAYHSEDGGKVGQAKHNPQPHQQLVYRNAISPIL